MDTKQIQDEINKINAAPFSKKSDKQLIAYDVLSILHKQKYAGLQPIALVKYNKSEHKLAKEFGISISLVYKIINRLKWKEF